MKYFLLLLITSIGTFLFGIAFGQYLYSHNQPLKNPLPTELKKNLEKYTIENLSETNLPQGNINITENIKEDKNYSSFLFEHFFDPTLANKSEKKVTGLINIPKGDGPFPIVIMIRGYVDQQKYQTGMGTKNAGEFFASKGFITIAPDFLGYGNSDSESESIFETRFQTYTTMLSVYSSLQSISKWDKKNVFIWAHSNGGQIALTTLEILGKSIPTALWAPVTAPFPYNVLYYTNESDDKGKLIRKELAKFENTYNADQFSFTNYLIRLKGPFNLHQGTIDDAVPISWSNQFVKSLEDLNIDINYYVYPNTDHNMVPNWDKAIARDLDFFQKNLQD